MTCCSNCFNDEEIKAIISGFQNVGVCPLCHSKEVYLYNAGSDPENKLKTLFLVITDAYMPYDSSTAERIELGAPKGRLETFLKHDTNIFSSALTESKIQEFLSGLFPEKRYLRKDIYAKCYTKGFKRNDLSIVPGGKWENLVQDLQHRSRFHLNGKINEDVMRKAFELCVHALPGGAKFYRARKALGHKPYPPGEMTAPPFEKCCAGRANPRGIRVLYLGDSEETVVRECRAGVFDDICVAPFALTRNVRVLDLNALSAISPFQFTDDYTFFLLNFPVLKKIGEEFSRCVRSSDNELEYLATQFVCDYIKNVMNLDGVMYASTVHHGGRNLALFDPDAASIVVDEERVLYIDEITPHYQFIRCEF